MGRGVLDPLGDDSGVCAAIPSHCEKKNGGPFDPPPVMQYRLVMKAHLPLARQRP
jgi:hypothetical protein